MHLGILRRLRLHTAQGITHSEVFSGTDPSRSGEHDGNEAEVLASILDELILELRGARTEENKQTNKQK